MADGSRWAPILEGADADAARAAVTALGGALAAREGDGGHPSHLALFWAYVAGAIDEPWTAAAYDAAIDALGAHVERGLSHRGLYGGVAGAGFTLAHVSEAGAADPILDAIDATLADALTVDRWVADYDLVGGLTGLGVYFLERLAHAEAPVARAGLARVVDHLLANAESTPGGLAWFTPAARLPPHQRERSPDGHFDCGLAHGVPGPLALLGRIAQEHSDDDRVRAAATSALGWLAAQALPPTSSGRYPSVSDRSGRPRSRARTAWCYGDPGVAIAAWSTARRLGLPDEMWRALAREATTRPIADTEIRDAGFCHGAAGLGHLANRAYQASGEPALRDAARRWFRATLAHRRPHGTEGIAGFAAWDPTTEQLVPATDLVEGATGVALALLAAIQPVAPLWDRLFLCDLPPGPA
jgi:hypothetical protein